MTPKRLRAVFDTNIFVAVGKSKTRGSINDELMVRWVNGEFTMLMSEVLFDEIVEKLRDRQVDPDRIVELVARIELLAEHVAVPPERVVRVIPKDEDDDHVVACAVVGGADYIVTRDTHFDPLSGEYQGIKIVDPLKFLWVVRDNVPL